MFKELAVYDRLTTENEARDALFLVLKKNLSGISVSPPFISPLKDLVTDGLSFASSIDYPNGNSDSQIRSHSIINSIRKGVNTIDLVANSSYMINNQANKYSEDIKNCLSLCREYDVTMRVILEYRLFETDTICKYCDILATLGVEYVIPSSGSIPDDIDDNLIISKLIQDKTGIKVITNGNVWRPQHYQKVEKAGIFGVRLYSISAVNNVFGVS